LSSPTGQIYYYTLESDSKGLRELSERERWVIIPTLKQVPGVADVQNFGGITTQFQLELDPQQLMRFNLSLANIESAITANSSSAGGSVVTRGELGKLKLANQERHGILGKNRKNDAVEGTVLLLKGANPSQVIDGIHAKVAE